MQSINYFILLSIKLKQTEFIFKKSFFYSTAVYNKSEKTSSYFFLHIFASLHYNKHIIFRYESDIIDIDLI